MIIIKNQVLFSIQDKMKHLNLVSHMTTFPSEMATKMAAKMTTNMAAKMATKMATKMTTKTAFKSI